MSNEKTEPKLFATSHSDWGNGKVKEEDLPATRSDVATYVGNAFKNWHEPDHLMLLRLASVIDTLLLFLGEQGIPVKDGKITLSVDEISNWAETKKTQLAAMAAAASDQSAPPDA